MSILLVDDRPENLQALEAVLEPLGQMLVRASSGEEALRAALKWDFAVILLDVQMAGIDGFETARLLKARERTRLTPIIFLTAISREHSYAMEGYAAGGVDFMPKPFEPEILRSKVAIFVDLALKRRQIAHQTQLLEARSAELEREVAERRRAEAEAVAARAAAEEASRAKSEFLSRMSHELRTPLNSVIGFAGVLLRNRRGHLDSAELEQLHRIRSNGQHLLHLINDILDLARVEAGKMDVDRRPIALDLLVAETVAELQGRVLQGEGGQTIEGVSIRAEVPSGLTPIVTDATKLKQIIINLVGNALKFTAAGSVTVRVIASGPPTVPGAVLGDRQRRAVRLEVADTGIGIPPARLAAIFEAFEQADRGTAAQYGGTGLGLSISRAFADLLGYRIAVRSTEGVGSVFSVILEPHDEALVPSAESEYLTPASESASGVPFGDPRAPSAGPGHTVAPVLLIEDSDDARELVIEQLRGLPVPLVTAGSGAEGLALARELRPALILLDLVMPSMSGWEVLGRLKTDPSLATIPVVVISSVAQSGRAAYLGTLDFLEKPVSAGDLLSTVRRHLPLEREARVLVVDDDPDARRLVSATLTECRQCVITEAADGVEALAELERMPPPDLIVLDIVMPRMDGFSVLTTLRADSRFARIPVVVASARDLSGEERASLEGVASVIVQKGRDLDQVLRDALLQAIQSS